MALTKRNYVDGETIITAQNLNDIQDEVIAHESNKVPTTRTVNSKALSSNITLNAADVGAVPTSRKVNNKALSADITLNASNIPNDSSVDGTTTKDAINKLADGEVMLAEEITNLNGAISDVAKSNNWYGKKLLIIGDSWSRGYTGSTYVDNPWCDVMVSSLGCTADYIRQGSGGFTTAASSTTGNTYPGETYPQVLEHVKNNKYDAIVVQAGWNDIHNDNTTDSDTASAITNFSNKCKSYFPKAKVFFLIAYPPWLMPYARLSRALRMVRSGYYNSMVVAHCSINWMFTNKSYRGADTPHLNQNGYTYFGKCAAAFLNGWDGKDIQAQQTWQQESGTVTANETCFAPTLNTTDINANTGAFYVKYANGTVACSLRFRTTTQATSGNVDILTGMPFPVVEMQYFNVSWYNTPASGKSLPRCTLTQDGKVRMVLTGDCYNEVIQITGNYQTRSNCIM